MDNKPLLALRIGLGGISIVMFCVGAYFYFSAGSSQTMNLWQFIPSAIMGGALFLVELYLTYAISTWLSIILIGVSFILFYLAIIDANPERKSGLYGFAGAVLGFATGIPIGQYNSTRRETT